MICFLCARVWMCQGVFEKGFEVFGIGEEGDLENAQKEDTLINMLILINSLYLCYV